MNHFEAKFAPIVSEFKLSLMSCFYLVVFLFDCPPTFGQSYENFSEDKARRKVLWLTGS